MKVLVQWLFRLLISLMLIAIIVPVAGSLLLDQEDLKASLSQWFQGYGDRQLEIDGRLGFRPGLGLIVFAEDVRLENAAWSRRPDAFHAVRVEARISLRQLLRGQIMLERVEVEQGSLYVEERSPGRFNFDSFRGDPDAEGRRGAPHWLQVQSLALTDSTIHIDLLRRDWDIRIDDGRIDAEGADDPFSVQLDGRLQSVGLSVTGTLGTPSSWLGRRPSAGNLVVSMQGEEVARATGTVGDVLSWRDIDAELAVRLERLRDISPWFRKQPLDLRDLALTGRLRQPGGLATMRIEALRGATTYRDIPIRASGRVDRLSRMEDIRIDLEGNDRWDMRVLPFRRPLTLAPQVSFTASLVGSSRELTMTLHDIGMTDGGIRLAGAGEVINLENRWRGSIPLTLEVDELFDLGQKLGRDWPRMGGLRANAQLSRNESGFTLDELTLLTRDGTVQASGTGNIRGIGKAVSGNVELSAVAGSAFFSVNGFLSALRPQSADATATWKMEGSRSWLEIDALAMALPAGSVNGVGTIGDLSDPGSLVLRLNGQVRDAAALTTDMPDGLPSLPPLGWSGELRRQDETRWSIERLEVEGARDEERMTAVASLRYADGRLDWSADGEAMVAVESIAPYLEDHVIGSRLLAGMEPVSARFRLQRMQGETSIPELHLESKWLGAPLRVAGLISGVTPLAGLLEVEWAGRLDGELPLPGVFPMKGIRQASARFMVPLPMAKHGIDDLRLLLESDRERLEITGKINATDPPRADDLKLRLQAEDLSALVPSAATLSPDRPLLLDADLILEDDTITANGSIRVADMDLRGSLNWRTAREEGGRHGLDVVLASDALDLTRILDSGAKGARLLPRDPLVPPWMEKVDGRVSLAAKDFRSASFHLQDVKSVHRFRNGDVTHTFEAHGSGGALSGRITVPGRGETSVDMVVNSVPVSSFVALSRGDVFQGGVIDAALTLRGQSANLAGLVDSGSGQLRLDIRRSKIYNKSLETVGGDLVTNFIATINPFRADKPYVEVECGAIYLDVDGGRAATRNGLALKTDRVTVLGGGEITFPGEEIKVILAPKARKGFGISATSIAKMIRLGGTLREPKIEADPRGLLKSGAALGAAIASGGVSLVALGLLDRLQANADVCAIAQGRKAPANGAGQGESNRR